MAKKCVKCASCRTEVDDKLAEYVTDDEGQKYYFCSGECKRDFTSGKGKYVK